MLRNYGLEEKLSEVKQWYDGYMFGETEVYNPWSIIDYVKTAISESQPFPKPYWSNTSSNSIIRELVEEADSDTKEEIQMLIDGKTIEKPVHEDITCEDIHKSQDNLWNFLFFTGYLKKVGMRFERKTKAIDFKPFYQAVLDGKTEEMEAGCKAALDQIEEKNYAAPFLDKGYTKIMKYGICFCEKTCMVAMR